MEGIAFLSTHHIALVILVAVMSLMIGSFLNVVIYRLPIMMKRQWREECLEFLSQPQPEKEERFNLLLPRSRCTQCHTVIKAWQNIPLISYLVLKGRCATCAALIPARYPIIEFTTAVLSAFIAWHFQLSFAMVAALILTWSLIAITVIDYDEQLIPDLISIPLLWLGLLVNLVGTFNTIESCIIGAILGYGGLWLFTHGYFWLTGKFGMGHGDFKLFAALGAWLGWQVLPFILIFSTFVGAVVGIGLLITKKSTTDKPIPFGPFLAVAGWIALIWGNQILTFYSTTLRG